MGLGTNVVYLAHAVPAAAVTDNSSVFTFARTQVFVPGSNDMKQNYTPAGSSTTCTVASGSTCTYFSDQFSTGQTMSAGSAVADLYLSDSANSIAFRSKRNGGGNASTITLLAPTSYVQGDLMIATISTRGGSGVTITPDAGWTLIRRVDNSTTLSLAVYWKVAAASELGDPAAVLDHLEPARDLSHRIGEHLAVLGRQDPPDLLPPLIDEITDAEEDCGASRQRHRTPRQASRRRARMN